MKVTFAPIQKCVRKLAPGEVKRCAARGPQLVGYHVACPACGGTFIYLHDEHRFVEGPWVEEHLPLEVGDGDSVRLVKVHRPTALGCEVPMTCHRCGRSITLRSDEIEAHAR